MPAENHEVEALTKMHDLAMSDNELTACGGRLLKATAELVLRSVQAEEERGVPMGTILLALILNSVACWASLIAHTAKDETSRAKVMVITKEMVCNALDKVSLEH